MLLILQHCADADAGLAGRDKAHTRTHFQASVFCPHPDRMEFAIGVRRFERQEVLRLQIVANARADFGLSVLGLTSDQSRPLRDSKVSDVGSIADSIAMFSQSAGVIGRDSASAL
jgi:hypothetical protein